MSDQQPCVTCGRECDMYSAMRHIVQTTLRDAFLRLEATLPEELGRDYGFSPGTIVTTKWLDGQWVQHLALLNRRVADAVGRSDATDDLAGNA